MNRTRPKQIVIRLSEEELAQIKEKVEQSGKSQQQYIIEALTQSNIVNLDGLKEIYPELKRQGNNLNQIAKKLNENGYVDYKQELPNTMKEVREVWQLLFLSTLSLRRATAKVHKTVGHFCAYETNFMEIASSC